MAIPYKNKWLSSYETLCFDTADGDLDKKQYALDEAGKGYYIRTKSKDESQFEHADLSYDISKLERVNVIPGAKCYYDEFLTAKGAEAIWGKEKKEIPSGGIIRVPSNAKKYWDTARIKDYPQPERIEMVSELPPPEPPQPHNKPHSIAFDATSNSGAKSDVSSYSWSHTTGSNENRLLVVGDSHYDGTTDRTVSSITYNSVAMTSIRSDLEGSDWKWRSTLYFLVAPTAGSHTVAVTLSGIASHVTGGAISYTGAAQTGQPDAHNGANGMDAPATVNVTTIADNSWVVSVISCMGFGDLASDNIERWNDLYNFGGSDTNGPKTPAGSQTMSWTGEYIDYWAISAASFAPAGEEEEEPTWLSGWLYRKKITIDADLIDADLNDFPVLVKLTSTNFDFSKVRSDGYDIRFTSSDGETLLKYERERHDSTNSLAECWVKIPAIDDTVDTDFYIYYGKSDASDGADPTNVWTNGQVGVWHMNEASWNGTPNEVKDSTSNTNHGTAAGNATTITDGKIDGAGTFDGNDDYVTISSNPTLEITQAITVSSWINSNTFAPSDWQGIITRWNTAEADRSWMIFIPSNSDGNIEVNSINFLVSPTGLYDSNYAVNIPPSDTSAGIWYHIAATYDETAIRIYLNGIVKDTLNYSAGLYGDPEDVRIGRYELETTTDFNGKVDNVMIFNRALTGAEIKADYNSGNNTLLSFGEEESGGPVLSAQQVGNKIRLKWTYSS